MMVDNAVSTITPGGTTANMSQFPEAAGEWVLYGCVTVDNATVNYVATEMTKGTYSVTSDGTVKQESTGYD